MSTNGLWLGARRRICSVPRLLGSRAGVGDWGLWCGVGLCCLAVHAIGIEPIDEEMRRSAVVEDRVLD